MPAGGLEQEAPGRIVHHAVEAEEVVGKEIVADDRREGDYAHRKRRTDDGNRSDSLCKRSGHDRASS